VLWSVIAAAKSQQMAGQSMSETTAHSSAAFSIAERIFQSTLWF
jgi:hypothetical protein